MHPVLQASNVAVVAAVVLAAGGTRAGEGGLALEEAVRLSLSGPAVAAGREAIVQARADVRSASAVPNPGASIGGGMLPLNRSFTTDAPGGPTEVAAGISLPIDWLVFGKLWTSRAAAMAQVEVVQAEQDDLVRLRVLETETAFYNVLEAKALLEVARQVVADLEEAEAAMRKAATAGGRPVVESMRARLELLSARREERSAQAALAGARAALRALVGVDADAAGGLDDPVEDVEIDVEAAFAKAAANRPDIRALRCKVAKARRDRAVEAGGILPEASLGLEIGHQFQEAIGAPDATGWGVSLDFSIPLFDQKQGERARAASAVVQAERDLDAALAALGAEVQQEASTLAAARETAAEVARADLAMAGEVRDSVRKAYEAGGRPYLELIDAQRSFREASRAHVTSRADYRRALSRFHAVLGGRYPR